MELHLEPASIQAQALTPPTPAPHPDQAKRRSRLGGPGLQVVGPLRPVRPTTVPLRQNAVASNGMTRMNLTYELSAFVVQPPKRLGYGSDGSLQERGS